jgi:aspartate/methionine/tyrosine aminotransferase
MVMAQLRDFRVIRAGGGWSLIWNVAELDVDGAEASRRLLERAKIAATPMQDWGAHESSFLVRLVFSNESVERLSGIRERVKRAFPIQGSR